MRGLLVTVVLSALVSLAAPAVVTAESTLWTLIATPTSATVGRQTSFALTATNEDPLAAALSSSEIGCLFVDVPANFSIATATVTGSTAGNSWHVHSVGGNRVTVHVNSGGDRLEYLQSVSFTITATPTSTGSLTWPARAFRDQDCAGSGVVLGVPPLVLVTASSPTPTPRPSPSPTPRPTATPLPVPSVPLPSLPLPSSPGLETPVPSAAPSASTGERSPGASPTNHASPGASPSNGAAPPGPNMPSEGGGSGNYASDDLPPLRVAAAMRNDVGGLLGDLVSAGSIAGVGTWAVPVATIGGAGLLVLLFAGLQAGATIVWVPAVRRLRGDRRPQRRRRH